MSSAQVNIPTTNPYLNPSYLLSLSSHIQTLSSFYTQENLPSLSSQYKSFLQTTFKNLSNYLTLFQEDQHMIISSLLSTKVDLELFLGQKLYILLQKQTPPLAQIIKFILLGYRENTEHYQEVLIKQKKQKVEVQNQKNEKIVSNLKKQVLIKRQYVKELQDRIKDLQEQNSKIYHKIIDNAKNTISATLVQSKVLTASSEFMNTGKFSKSSLSHTNKNPPTPHKVSHKQLSLKQVQQTILELMTLKRKQQLVSQKRTAIKSYLKHYFKYKFGLADLSEQMKSNFIAALKYFLTYAPGNNENSHIQRSRVQKPDPQKPLLLLFYKLSQQQIDEQYFWKEYLTKGQKIIKVFKRYLNEKQKIELKQLDRLYDGSAGISGFIPNYSSNKIVTNENEKKDLMLNQNDVRNILVNIYKSSSQIQTLQMIFYEIINKSNLMQSQVQQEPTLFIPRLTPLNPSSNLLPSKLLLNMILCYEIESYSLKLCPLSKVIKKHSNLSQFVTVSYSGLQKVILQLSINQQSYMPYLQKNYEQLKGRQFTYSEIIQIICAQILGGGYLQNSKYGTNNPGSSRKF